jgi:hypothetical protein
MLQHSQELDRSQNSSFEAGWADSVREALHLKLPFEMAIQAPFPVVLMVDLDWPAVSYPYLLLCSLARNWYRN